MEYGIVRRDSIMFGNGKEWVFLAIRHWRLSSVRIIWSILFTSYRNGVDDDKAGEERRVRIESMRAWEEHIGREGRIRTNP